MTKHAMLLMVYLYDATIQCFTQSATVFPAMLRLCSMLLPPGVVMDGVECVTLASLLRSQEGEHHRNIGGDRDTEVPNAEVLVGMTAPNERYPMWFLVEPGSNQVYRKLDADIVPPWPVANVTAPDQAFIAKMAANVQLQLGVNTF